MSWSLSEVNGVGVSSSRPVQELGDEDLSTEHGLLHGTGMLTLLRHVRGR